MLVDTSSCSGVAPRLEGPRVLRNPDSVEMAESASRSRAQPGDFRCTRDNTSVTMLVCLGDLLRKLVSAAARGSRVAANLAPAVASLSCNVSDGRACGRSDSGIAIDFDRA